jgi:site-specific recombinase XerD
MAKLRQEARGYKRSAFAEATKRTYRSHLTSYLKFCSEYKQTPIPVSQDTIVSYVVYLARRLKPSSIPGYLNIIRIVHVEAGLPNPLTNNWEVQLLKRGINRQKGSPPNQKAPITIQILSKIHSVLHLGDPADVAFWSALLVGFYGFFRKSTLLPPTKKPIPGKYISRADIVDFTLESFSLVIRHSKVIQFGQRIQIVPFSRVSVVHLCPVRALLIHVGMSRLGSTRPIFNYCVAGAECVLTHECFVSRLRRALADADLDPKKYSAHSLRRGGASFAFQIGLSHVQVKERGDWASNAFEKYIHINSDSLMETARAMANGVTLV